MTITLEEDTIMIDHLNTAMLPEPPPVRAGFRKDLFDADIAVGAISPETIAFTGFGSETEAAHASWVAHRALNWRLAAKMDRRPAPVDIEPLTVVREGDGLYVHASRKPIARLLEPSDAYVGWGFELRLPEPMPEFVVGAKAKEIYRTLRRSGVRWTLWRAPALAGT